MGAFATMGGGAGAHVSAGVPGAPGLTPRWGRCWGGAGRWEGPVGGGGGGVAVAGWVGGRCPVISAVGPSSGADNVGDGPVISGVRMGRPSSGADGAGEGTGWMGRSRAERGVNAGAVGLTCWDGRCGVSSSTSLRAKERVN